MPEDPASGATPYSLYIVRCEDESLYTGIALDVGKRFEEHLSGRGGAKYFRGRRPVEVVFCAPVGDRSEASRVERSVKRMTRAQKLSLVRGEMPLPAVDQASGSAAG